MGFNTRTFDDTRIRGKAQPVLELFCFGVGVFWALAILVAGPAEAATAGEVVSADARLGSLHPQTQIFLLGTLSFPQDGRFRLEKSANGRVLERYDFYQAGHRLAPSELNNHSPYCAVVSRPSTAEYSESAKSFEVDEEGAVPASLRGRDLGVGIGLTSIQQTRILRIACASPGGNPKVSNLLAAIRDGEGDVGVSVLLPPPNSTHNFARASHTTRSRASLARAYESPEPVLRGERFEHLASGHREYLDQTRAP